jgi:hypothetical protein
MNEEEVRVTDELFLSWSAFPNLFGICLASAFSVIDSKKPSQAIQEH